MRNGQQILSGNHDEVTYMQDLGSDGRVKLNIHLTKMDMIVRTGLNWLVFCGGISVNIEMNSGLLHSVGNFLMSSKIGKAQDVPHKLRAARRSLLSVTAPSAWLA